MKHVATLKYDDVDFVWIQDHWDIHLVGLCRFNGHLCRFTTYEERMTAEIHSLNLIEKMQWLFNKTMFEWFIGYHWTYPQRENGVVYGNRKPAWFWRLMFMVYYGIRKFGGRP